MPSILHLRTKCNSKIEQTWVISCTEKNTLNAIKANHSLNIISDLMATASSYYGRLYKVLSNNTQQSITATWEGGGAYLNLLLSFWPLQTCLSLVPGTTNYFSKEPSISSGRNGWVGSKRPHVVGLLTGPLFGPRGRCGVPWTNWQSLSPFKVQHWPPRLCQESQSDCRPCILRTHSW